MFTLIINAMLPIYVGLLIGYLAGKFGLVDNKNVKNMNVMLMTFMVPLTMFIAISRTPRDVIMPNLILILVIGLTMLISYLTSLWIQKKFFGLKPGDSVVQSLTIAFPNYASIGIALTIPLFGDEAALLVAIAIAAGSIFVTPIALAQLAMSISDPGEDVSIIKAFIKGLVSAVKTPVFFLPVLGLIWALLGLPMPNLLETAFYPITVATGGVGLFLTGILLSAQKIKVDKNVSLSTFLSNIVQPLMIFAIAILLGLSHESIVQAVILMAIPSAFFGLVFGAQYDLRPAVSGATLLVSSITGAITVSAFIAWLAPAIGG